MKNTSSITTIEELRSFAKAYNYFAIFFLLEIIFMIIVGIITKMLSQPNAGYGTLTLFWITFCIFLFCEGGLYYFMIQTGLKSKSQKTWNICIAYIILMMLFYKTMQVEIISSLLSISSLILFIAFLVICNSTFKRHKVKPSLLIKSSALDKVCFCPSCQKAKLITESTCPNCGMTSANTVNSPVEETTPNTTNSQIDEETV